MGKYTPCVGNFLKKTPTTPITQKTPLEASEIRIFYGNFMGWQLNNNTP